MSRLRENFRAVRAARRGGFIPFLVAGDPDLTTTCEVLTALDRLEPAAIEVGVPFSDPTADGPVIQRAAQRALRNGTTLSKILDMLHRLRLTIALRSFFSVITTRSFNSGSPHLPA